MHCKFCVIPCRHSWSKAVWVNQFHPTWIDCKQPKIWLSSANQTRLKLSYHHETWLEGLSITTWCNFIQFAHWAALFMYLFTKTSITLRKQEIAWPEKAYQDLCLCAKSLLSYNFTSCLVVSLSDSLPQMLTIFTTLKKLPTLQLNG